jgi:STE24 endopeptidase
VANEDKATRYHRQQRRVALATTALGLAFLVLSVATGAAIALSEALAGVVGGSRVLVAVLFVLVLATLHELLALPLAFHAGVTLERRYGLSSESLAHWWGTHLKGFAVGVVMTSAAGVIVALLLAWSPERWWIGAAVVFAALLAAVVFVAPVWLFPLFYDVRPLDRPALTARLESLARQAGAPVSGVYEWRLGDRTRKANAALVGLGRTRRILLSDTLLTSHADDEIEVVLAHELAHQVHGDLWTSLLLQSAFGAAGLYAAHRALQALALPLGTGAAADVAVLPVVALAAGIVSLLLSPLAHAVSRAHERRADRYAIDLTGNAGAFMSAIRRLSEQNLAEEEPAPWIEALLHSHPSTRRRLDAARRWASTPASRPAVVSARRE